MTSSCFHKSKDGFYLLGLASDHQNSDLGRIRGLVFAVGIMLWMGMMLWAAPLQAATITTASIANKLPIVHAFFPKATRFGKIQGKPPAAAVYESGKVVGYVFKTVMIAPIPAYSGKPINVLVGINTKGEIVGTKVLNEDEPIFLIGIPVQKLYDYIRRFIGLRVTDRLELGSGKNAEGYVRIDGISGATVTSLVASASIMRAALKVAASRGIVHVNAAPLATIKTKFFMPADWQKLLKLGLIGHLVVTFGQVRAAFKDVHGYTQWGSGNYSGVESKCKVDLPKGQRCFISLYYADLTIPTVGRNFLGDRYYKELMASLHPGDHALAVVANGDYSFKGIGYVRGGVFGRLHLMQGSSIIIFHGNDYRYLINPSLKGMPHFSQMATFIIRGSYKFNPGAPWRLQLIVKRQTGPLTSVLATFSSHYRIPSRFLNIPKVAAPMPLWESIWRRHQVDIAILIAALGVLLLIMIFQDLLAQHPRILYWTRISYLVFTAGYVGFYLMGQLSVVNVFTFLHALSGNFTWKTFLLDPVIFILWVFVAVIILLWGRGVYCGWLCPYGALQQLISYIGRALHVPEFKFPMAVHERLWALKYVILLILFAISLQSVANAERFAEVEPFKTVFLLHFGRQWWFGAYAAGLLAVSLFNDKFFCKYICPLGAALAIPSKFRRFDWLKRRIQCGHPCQICANECEVQAIAPTGEIRLDECHHCLDCQATYWNDRKCPPLVERRKRFERALKMNRPVAVAPVVAKKSKTENSGKKKDKG